MTTTYLEVVNEVLGELNETELSSSNFASAKNIQATVKRLVARSYFDIYNPENKWPWLSAGPDLDGFYGNVYVETVAGQRWYDLNASRTGVDDDYGWVDWDHFTLTTNGVAGESAPYTVRKLDYMMLEDWRDYYSRQEEADAANTQVYSTPRRVIRNPNNYQFGLSGLPDKVYRVYFYAWNRPSKLVLWDDNVQLPDQYIPVLVARARYFAWQRKENPQQAALAMEDFKKGLRGMRETEIDGKPTSFTDDRVRFV